MSRKKSSSWASASASRRPITVSGRNTRLRMSSLRNAARMVAAQAGASAAWCRPERLIEKWLATRRVKGTLSDVIGSVSADELIQRLRNTLAVRADEPSTVLVHEQIG